MHTLSRQALPLIGLMAMLAVPRASAQQPLLPPPPSHLPTGQPLTYRYSDSDGFGSITLTDLGPDDATGGQQLRVSIIQKGVEYHGSGIYYPLAGAPQPYTDLVTFTVVGPNGASYFFQGKMGLGVEFIGHGTYHPVLYPQMSSGWGLLALPFPHPNQPSP